MEIAKELRTISPKTSIVFVTTSESHAVNALLPGSTDTGLKDEFAMATGGEDKLKEGAGYAKRLAKSAEMGEPVVFLNSQMARFISGELLVVDYGCIIERKTKIVTNPNQFTFAMIAKQAGTK